MDVLRFSGVIAILIHPPFQKVDGVPPMGLEPMSAIPATDVPKHNKICRKEKDMTQNVVTGLAVSPSRLRRHDPT